MIIFFLAAFVLCVVAMVSLVSALINKKSKKPALIFFISGIICLVIPFVISPAATTIEKTVDSQITTEQTETPEQSKKETYKVGDTIEQTEASEQPKEKTYKVGDTIKINNSDGSYTLTITGVSETADRNQFSDIKADRVIIIDYVYENIDTDDELYIFDLKFKAYDADNNTLEIYPADIKYSKSIGAGRKTTGQMAFALNNATNKIELEYFDNMFNDSKDCLIVIEW